MFFERSNPRIGEEIASRRLAMTKVCAIPCVFVRVVAGAAFFAGILYWRERCRAWLARRASADRSIFLPHPDPLLKERERRAVSRGSRRRTLFLVNLFD
jgi:hypothetical protein